MFGCRVGKLVCSWDANTTFFLTVVANYRTADNRVRCEVVVLYELIRVLDLFLIGINPVSFARQVKFATVFGMELACLGPRLASAELTTSRWTVSRSGSDIATKQV